MGKYTYLFQPLKVGGIYLRNRITCAPMGNLRRMSTAYWLEHLAAISRGGASLITLGSIHVDKDESLIVPHGVSFHLPHMARLAEELSAIHQHGAKASVELIHCGMWAVSGDPKYPPVGPCDRLRDEGKDADGAAVKGLSQQDMQIIADKYAAAAVSAKRLGFDMVMLHFAHGWLPAQFLSPYFNKRTDEYGGSFENRIRFPMMIIDKVRAAVGKDFPIELRISAEEYLGDCFHLDECIAFVKRAEAKIDLVHVSSGVDKYFETTTRMMTCALLPQRPNVRYAEAIKKAVSIPVVVVGALSKPEDMEELIASGAVDAVAVARGLIADPELPEKARTGREEDIVPCLRCVSCYHVATQHYSLGCAVNPGYGRECRLDADIKKAASEKHVVVVGGGVAGMKAAVTAAERGHRVTLLEKEPELGGIIRFTDYDDKKEELNRYKRYLIGQVRRHSAIKVRVNTEADPDSIRDLKPDFLVIAVGSLPVVPRIAGVEGENVMDILTAYRHLADMPQRVAVIGGGQAGSELALSLAQKGHEVTLVEMAEKLAQDANLTYQTTLEQLVKEEKNLTVRLNSVCEQIEESGIIVKSKESESVKIEADAIVYAVGMRPRKEVAERFIDIAYDVRLIGDCAGARRVNEATYEGYFSVSNV